LLNISKNLLRDVVAAMQAAEKSALALGALKEPVLLRK
jgi:hypothetical protein